mmetsp:Transcript_26041/g.62130  ORF Transcript_26041/g.62130 Transcript_26041/m.62130 type:complete len:269 (-) Transcript_26041:266-1072(-)
MPLRLARLPGHNLGAVNEEKEGAALARKRLADHGLAAPRRAVQQHPARGVHADLGEELRVLERQLDDLAQLSDLLGEAADVIVADLANPVGVRLVALERRALGEDDALGRHDREGRVLVVNLHHLEVHGAVQLLVVHREHLPDMHRPEVVLEIRLEENLKNIAVKAMQTVLEGKDVDALGVFDVRILRNLHAVGIPDLQPAPHGLREASLLLLDGGVRHHDADSLPRAAPLNENRVPVKQPDLLHARGVDPHNGVVLACGLLHEQPVG